MITRLSLFFVLLSVSFFLEAQTSEIKLEITKLRPRVSFRVIADSNFESCQYKLFSGKGRKSRRGKIVARFASYGPVTKIYSDHIKSFSADVQDVFFRIKAKCEDTSLLSNKVYVSSASIKGIKKFKKWRRKLRQKLGIFNLKVLTVADNLTFENPVDLQSLNISGNKVLLAEQTGKIKLVDLDNSTSQVILDLTDLVSVGGEGGLLGLAVSPDFNINKLIFVNYTRNADGATVVSNFKLDSLRDLNSVDSENILLVVEQPFANHNGGQLAFGPDSLLYIALGDGGSGGDPENNAQNTANLLGAMLRLDVDSLSSYAVPEDNPFVDKDGVRPEIFAYGFRNPWRFSFDVHTEELWLADVGQATQEEINIVRAGGNYGWKIEEGETCFGFTKSPLCGSDSLIRPVKTYERLLGRSITGGYVYRGETIQALLGYYLYADFVTGRIWALNAQKPSKRELPLFDTDIFISSFGTDRNNELYFLDYINGKIKRISR